MKRKIDRGSGFAGPSESARAERRAASEGRRPEPTAIEQDRYAVAKTALAQLPHPVVMIGAAAGGERSCATGTAMYVSLAPAQIAIAVHPGSNTAKLIERSGEFSISVLTQAQQDLATAAGHSGPPGEDKLTALGIPVADPPAGCSAPGVAGSIAVLWCRVVDRLATGDQVLQIGEVVAHTRDEHTVDALLRFRRRYWNIGHWTSDESPEGYPT